MTNPNPQIHTCRWGPEPSPHDRYTSLRAAIEDAQTWERLGNLCQRVDRQYLRGEVTLRQAENLALLAVAMARLLEALPERTQDSGAVPCPSSGGGNRTDGANPVQSGLRHWNSPADEPDFGIVPPAARSAA